MTSRPLLVLDTATRTPVVALAGADGAVLAEQHWQSRHRHGEELLDRMNRVLAESGTARRELAGVIVGIGPGSFTGLRIGLATAKVIAWSLPVPLVGISTTHALALAAASALGASAQADRTDFAVSLPAGAVDRYVHHVRISGESVVEEGPPQLVAGDEQFALAVGEATLVAVDLEEGGLGVELGGAAVAGLASALAVLGSRQLARGATADPAELVPAYVALPRGIARAAAEMEWSPDLR